MAYLTIEEAGVNRIRTERPKERRSKSNPKNQNRRKYAAADVGLNTEQTNVLQWIIHADCPKRKITFLRCVNHGCIRSTTERKSIQLKRMKKGYVLWYSQLGAGKKHRNDLNI